MPVIAGCPTVERGHGPLRLLFCPPLFEEMNRCRRLLALTGAALADRGVATLLPDLPGTGDHPTALADVTLEDWRAALAAVAAQWRASHLLAVRSGVLIAASLPLPLRTLAALPDGERQWRLLARAGGISTDATLEQTAVLAGYAVTPGMAASLRSAIVDLAADAAIEVAGPPLWLQAEPDDAAGMADALAAALHDWMRA